jgi:hypothetical protein
MEQNSSKGQNSRKTAYYAGAGLAIGAGIGALAPDMESSRASAGGGPQRDPLLCAGGDADAHDEHSRADLADRSKPGSPADHRDRDDLAGGTPLPRADSTERRIALRPADMVGAEGLNSITIHI